MVLKSIVITVPHAVCDTQGRHWPHPCDYVAVPGAQSLDKHLKKRGHVPNVMIGNVNRAILDLNRPEAANSGFHRTLAEKLQPGCVYVDMHSYPEEEYWKNVWGGYDLVFCAFPNVNLEVSNNICAKLNAHGVRCKVDTPQTVPALKDYYLIQKFGPIASIPLMIELNEYVTPRRRDYAMDVLAHYLS